MYQIRRKHTKCVVDFGQANMLGHGNYGYRRDALTYKDESKRGEGALSV